MANTFPFINEDLIFIHKTIDESLHNHKNSDIKTLNELLSAQIENLLEKLRSESDANKTKVEMPSIDKVGINCIQCNRPCRKRASFCNTGSHWIHYKCEKLNPSENERILKMTQAPITFALKN
ncbi:Hypothetical predicted protein [Mytilus galloprovincialis]|uniref:Uncharacterized protein n=1 Tax=Mytilus galloprovincialis TaxID=29158 RepID=A0A8B6GYP2_MYTGA|nr:Hypothetical predicted protein [Mytilus galloprovincialis]